MIATTSEFYDSDTRETAIESVPRTSESSTTASRDESERNQNRADLVEMNQLVTDRVDELETALEQKNERIDRLEATIEDLKTKLAERNREVERTRVSRCAYCSMFSST